MVKRARSFGSSSSSSAAPPSNRQTTEDSTVSQARLEAERRGEEYDGAKAAYDVARGEVKDADAALRQSKSALSPELRADLRSLSETELVDFATSLGEKGACIEWMDARDELGRLNDELAGLEKARDQAFENKKAADEALKRQEEKEAREEAREGAAGGGVSTEALGELKTEFGSQMEPSLWDFDFVKTVPFVEVCRLVRNVVSEFYHGPKTATPFIFPVVDGASGSGKSRTCVEVGKAFEAERNAVSLFMSCDKVVLIRPGDEKNALAAEA